MKTILISTALAKLEGKVWLAIHFDAQGIYKVEYHTRMPRKTEEALSAEEAKVAKKITSELSRYARDPHHRFNLPLMPQGTAFQQKVWRFMQTIPVGETRTYGDAAHMLNTSPRAVGGACGANPLPLFIPCHRIVGKNHLGGFAHQRGGAMIALKTELLIHEGVPLH